MKIAFLLFLFFSVSFSAISEGHKKKSATPSSSISSSSSVSDLECETCEGIIFFLELLLGENATQEEIWTFLDQKVCPLLQNVIPMQTCEGFVSLYGPYLVHVLLTEENPDKVCEIIGVCANTTEKKQGLDIGFFWQISDMHMDKEYKSNADAKQRCVKGKGNSGIIGDYVCDSTITLISETLSFMSQKMSAPDFILWTGDSPPHYLDFTSVEPYTPAMVLDAVNRVTQLITQYFPNVQVYPSIGNHDNYLADQLAPPPDGTAWLKQLSSMWGKFFSSDPTIVKTFNYGGYYTTLLSPSLRLLSLNTIYYDALNTWMWFDTEGDVARQIQWMNDTLKISRSKQEKVYIIGHIAPGVPSGNVILNYFDHYNRKVLAIYEEYKDVILHSFYAHEHSDSFRILFDSSTNQHPVASMFVAPGLTTFQNYNPSVRLYSYDRNTGLVLNYYQWYTNITEDNMSGKVKYHYSYDAIHTYGVSDLSLSSMLGMYNDMRDTRNETTWLRYLERFNGWSQSEVCEGECKRVHLCSIGNFYEDWLSKCITED